MGYKISEVSVNVFGVFAYIFQEPTKSKEVMNSIQIISEMINTYNINGFVFGLISNIDIEVM